MTTRNSTSAQLKGDRIKTIARTVLVAMNITSVIGILLFVIISKIQL